MEAKFFRLLKVVGVGFKARSESQGRKLFLELGYSHEAHEVRFTAPPAVRVLICCIGIDKDRVHQFAGAVRSCKPPDVYKGKGILYIDEVIKRKWG
ncbi:60S ribosomal protein L6, mitochondrial-like [Panicum virgatum]|uniref:60S ribosomal protein L6, mitochondrial-like n=1 Tax=Panicum virgatum TaxID=38727 RepID=UPI0019D621F2|nr:60S ribosomal protein L6, mitochondrial-like [Panicum virgatum]